MIIIVINGVIMDYTNKKVFSYITQEEYDKLTELRDELKANGYKQASLSKLIRLGVQEVIATTPDELKDGKRIS